MGFKKRPKLKPLNIRYTGEFGMYVTYQLDNRAWGSLDDKLDEAVGKPHSGGGTGLGGRDLDYWFDTAKEMLAAVKRIKALKLKGVEVSHDELCSRCKGEGRISTRVRCPDCNGTGKA